jgi:5-methylcytosine-specific restriction endonuclease McrA
MERQALCHAHLLARRRAHYAALTTQHRAERLAVGAAWRRQHGHAQRAAYLAAWRAANPERALRSRTRQRARAAGLTLVELPFTQAQLDARLSMFGGHCWLCGRPDADSVDHVKPLTAGGLHGLCNLRPACKACNWAKSSCWPWPFAPVRAA